MLRWSMTVNGEPTTGQSAPADARLHTPYETISWPQRSTKNTKALRSIFLLCSLCLFVALDSDAAMKYDGEWRTPPLDKVPRQTHGSTHPTKPFPGHKESQKTQRLLDRFPFVFFVPFRGLGF